MRIIFIKHYSIFKYIKTIGIIASWVGYSGLFILVSTIFMMTTKTDLLVEFDNKLSLTFIFFLTWGFFELIHHHVYKLFYGKYDTLEYIVKSGNWTDSKKPIGGAIGIQVKKLRLKGDGR